ncbi:thioredoxin family protein [Neolewinella antarctica]|uniref:Thioredoxin-related protein n=1 Tax=Neolewinella antarctica TaxID=442734 RepID=A0ABX0XD09_9BACT|nr:thioredoxin family protein [Neolewinella antarctica]NJC26672.1 thioredoxin-related protein [Neolewinella antarctica]
MKIIVFAFFACLLALPLSAQTWTKSFAEAETLAVKNGKNIVLVFAGSDWCAPCMRLDREIWSAEGFADAAGKDFVFYKADFPRRKANQLPQEISDKNAQLAERYNTVGSFPLVVILSPTGKVLGQTGYKDVPATEYLGLLKSFGR